MQGTAVIGEQGTGLQDNNNNQYFNRRPTGPQSGEEELRRNLDGSFQVSTPSNYDSTGKSIIVQLDSVLRCCSDCLCHRLSCASLHQTRPHIQSPS